MEPIRFQCATCGEEHVGLPDLGVAEPLSWANIPLEERAGRGELTSETCRIDDEHFFVRGVLELPIAGRDAVFGYGVWVSLSATNFARFEELGGADRGTEDGPWLGWLNVRIPGYPDTASLKARVHLRPTPTRPRVELEPTGHLLAMEQRVGVRLARVMELVELSLHPDPDRKLTKFPYVTCGTHGEGHGCFVCQHVADGSGTGWFASERGDDPWPDAWCQLCEDAYQAAGGWTDESQEVAGIKLICHFCYEERREAALA